jgi:hypothetical protein
MKIQHLAGSEARLSGRLRGEGQANPISAPAAARFVRQFRTALSAYLTTERVAAWGWMPFFVVLSGCVLLALSTAATASRFSLAWAQGLFWVAIVSLFAAAAWRQLSPGASRQERIGILIIVGLTCYTVKIMSYPSHFSYFDEFLHWQTTNDMLTTHRLFTANPMLPVSPLYPGLELITTAIIQFTGLTVTEAGLIVIGTARVILMVSLFLLFEEISGTVRVAGLAALLYMCHTNFLFWSSEFSYEPLALPLATFTLFAIMRRVHRRDYEIGRLLLIALPVMAIAITHHLTGYALTVITIAWAAVTYIRWRGARGWLDLALIGACILLATGGWTNYVGNATTNYLGPVIRGGVTELFNYITGEATGRQLFQTSSGVVSPLWERLTALSAVGLIMLMIPVGLFFVWQKYRAHTLALTLACLVVAYPFMQLFRLTSSGWELASRSAGFLFWGISFVLAVGFIGLLSRFAWLNNRAGRAAMVVYVSVIFLGGALSGWPGWARLPGDYIVAGDPRAIERQGTIAAKWVGANLPPNNRIGADRVNMLQMSVWGNQRPVTHLYDKVNISDVFFAPTFGDRERALLKETNTRYLIVDRRLTLGLPILGSYFESTENNEQPHKKPLDLNALLKFGAITDVDRIYDSGDINIYDVSRSYADAP